MFPSLSLTHFLLKPGFSELLHRKKECSERGNFLKTDKQTQTNRQTHLPLNVLEVARLLNLPQNVLNGNGGHLSQRQLGGQRVQRRVVVGQVVKGLVKVKTC